MNTEEYVDHLCPGKPVAEPNFHVHSEAYIEAEPNPELQMFLREDNANAFRFIDIRPGAVLQDADGQPHTVFSFADENGFEHFAYHFPEAVEAAGLRFHQEMLEAGCTEEIGMEELKDVLAGYQGHLLLAEKYGAEFRENIGGPALVTLDELREALPALREEVEALETSLEGPVWHPMTWVDRGLEAIKGANDGLAGEIDKINQENAAKFGDDLQRTAETLEELRQKAGDRGFFGNVNKGMEHIANPDAEPKPPAPSSP
ncbi:MAG: hypothetical protein ACLFP8_05770 [Alphaproteobacteria bacterium]